MGAPKGSRNNPNGRPKGSRSLKTIEWEEFGSTLLTTHLDRANQILATCDDETFMKYYMPLLEYFKPRLARTESINKNDNQVVISVNWENGKPIHQLTDTTFQPVQGFIGSESIQRS